MNVEIEIGQETLDRFWSRVRVAGADDCWEWQGARVGEGYGRFQGGGEVYAHRFSRLIHYGSLTRAELVLHSCDNCSCVNPAHLSVGSQLDNMQDAHRKGRHSHGERHYATRLIDEDILMIRHLAGLGARTAHMAIFWQLKPATIRKIVRGETWKHLLSRA